MGHERGAMEVRGKNFDICQCSFRETKCCRYRNEQIEKLPRITWPIIIIESSIHVSLFPRARNTDGGNSACASGKISKSEEGKVKREGRRKKSVATRKDVKLSLCRIRGKRRYLPVRWIRIREGSRGEDPSREYPTCLVFKVIDPRVPR